MSETLVLVFTESRPTLLEISTRLTGVADATVRNRTLVAQSGGERCYLVAVEDVRADGVFEDWPREWLPDDPENCSVFSLDYRNPRLAVSLVRELATFDRIVVDTNYDVWVEGSDLAESMLRGLAPS